MTTTPSSSTDPVSNTVHRSGTGAVSWAMRLRRGTAGVAFLAVGGLAWWWLATHHFSGGDHEEPAAAPSTEATATAPTIVSLSAAAARDEIHLSAVQRRVMREHLTVPGRLDYDARTRLAYDAPVDGIVTRVLVKVRQRVEKGDSLAEISSAEVGIARDDVRKRRDDLDIARQAAEWSAGIADNVQSLLTMLDNHTPLAEVEAAFDGRLLGAYRERILAAYSKLLYVEKVNADTVQLGAGGVLSTRIIQERTSNLEVARASFSATCEEARFATIQDRAKAQAALDQAKRLLQVAEENLRTLVGSRLDASAASLDEAGDTSTADEDGISAITLRTPLAGIVEEVFVSRGERVTGGEQMFVVADTSDLWVRAQVHEKQWTSVEVADGQEVSLVMPGAEEHRAKATINHIGATVDPDSRSVPIVADLANDDAHFKPGMFVWVELPQGAPRDVLAVPETAVMRHEDRAFVFVPSDPGRYRRVDVTTGITDEGWIEISKGLDPGQQVVAGGAFLLKSEMLLEDEG